jgi:peptide deformylase
VLFVDRLDAQTHKAAMRAIREAPWSALANPTVKLSTHAGR